MGQGHRSGHERFWTRAAVAGVLAAAIGAWGACAKSLDALTPFPCAADQTCPDGFTCQSVTDGGTACLAALTCTGNLTPCNGACVDLTKSDPSNCGGCGIACGPGSDCCSNACASLDSDANNCGTCGKVCQHAESCIGGTCKCAPGQQTCAGNCADVTSDPNNCGKCGMVCPNSGACMKGVCQPCPPQMTMCNGTCAYLDGDPANCGSCGNACGGQPCHNGACGCIQCGSAPCNTCNDTTQVIYCDSTSTIVCCAPDHPFFCENTAPGVCWNIPIDCTAAVMCSDGNWHGCLQGQTFDCTSMMCM